MGPRTGSRIRLPDVGTRSHASPEWLLSACGSVDLALQGGVERRRDA